MQELASPIFIDGGGCSRYIKVYQHVVYSLQCSGLRHKVHTNHLSSGCHVDKLLINRNATKQI